MEFLLIRMQWISLLLKARHCRVFYVFGAMLLVILGVL